MKLVKAISVVMTLNHPDAKANLKELRSFFVYTPKRKRER